MSSPKFARLFLALPLAAAALANSAQASAVAWRTNLDAAKIEASQSGKLLLLHFYTDTCGPCKLLDKQVFNQPHVGAAIEKAYVPVKVNAAHSPALAGMFRIERWPTDLILSPQGSMLAQFGCPNKPEAYLAQLENLATHYQQTTSTSRTINTPQRTNAAYAGLESQLPPSAAAVSNRLAMTQAAEGSTPQTSRSAAATVPQVTPNPYVTTPSANTAKTSTTGAPAPMAVQTINRTNAAPTTAATATTTTRPAMPANAMPQSYRYQVSPTAGGTTADADSEKGATTTAQTMVKATPITPTPRRSTIDSAVIPTKSQSVVAQPTTSPVATQLPTGSPPLGFDGCCPVTLKFANKWVAGRVEVGMEHRGRLYLFAGEKERQQFAANPDAYSPVFAGFDPVLMLDENRAVTGHRQFGFRYQGQFYLFSSAETKQQFADNPTAYANGVRQAMHRIDASDTGIIRR